MNHYVVSFDHNTWTCSCSAENTYGGEQGAQVTCQECDSFLYIPFVPSLTIENMGERASDSSYTVGGTTYTFTNTAEPAPAATVAPPPPKGPEIWGLPKGERDALEKWLALLSHPRGGVPERMLPPEEVEPLASLTRRGVLVQSEKGIYRPGHPDTWGEAIQAVVYERD